MHSTAYDVTRIIKEKIIKLRRLRGDTRLRGDYGVEMICTHSDFHKDILKK